MSEASSPRQRSHGEEIANSISHGAGLIAALIAIPFLIAAVARHGPLVVVSTSIYCVTIVLVYLTSTIYHALPAGRGKLRFEVLDNAAVFLLIAGTYTPFTLGVLRGSLGWSLFGIVWTLAAAGVAMKLVAGVRYPVLSMFLYLAMGWLVLFALRPLSLRVPLPGVALLFAGGVAYTAGVAFYAARRLRYHHLIWHLFVILGSACHFLAILWYAR
jgi:hemolysin III